VKFDAFQAFWLLWVSSTVKISELSIDKYCEYSLSPVVLIIDGSESVERVTKAKASEWVEVVVKPA
jgi:hypothetical protein